MSGWLSGHQIGGLAIVVLLSGKVSLQKAFLQLPWERKCWCLMAMLVSWWRDEYDRNGS